MLGIKKILGQIRKAVEEYQMIDENDKVAIGVSGGKDSMALLKAFKHFKSFYPKSFELIAINLTTGLGEDISPIREFCKTIDVHLHVEETLISRIVFEEMNESNPCSLCANLRRGALNSTAIKLGCNKVALGHHNDDLIETFMLSLLYEGRLNTFLPKTYLSRSNMWVIRPFLYTKEYEIKTYVKQNNIPIVKSLCKIDGKTKREDMKKLIKELSAYNRDARSNIFGAIKRSDLLKNQ